MVTRTRRRGKIAGPQNRKPGRKFADALLFLFCSGALMRPCRLPLRRSTERPHSGFRWEPMPGGRCWCGARNAGRCGSDRCANWRSRSASRRSSPGSGARPAGRGRTGSSFARARTRRGCARSSGCNSSTPRARSAGTVRLPNDGRANWRRGVGDQRGWSNRRRAPTVPGIAWIWRSSAMSSPLWPASTSSTT